MDSIKNFVTEHTAVIILVLGGIVILFAIIMLILLIMQIRTRKKLRYFMRGKNELSLENVLEELIDENGEMTERLNRDDALLKVLKEHMQTAYRRCGVVKYNAFPGMVGKISAATALLTNENSGFIINSIHSSEGCYTYTKEVINGKSISQLTPEEEEALNIALQA